MNSEFSPCRVFILRPVTTILLMAAIVLLGTAAYLQLPISALPQVDYPTIQVQTFYPGASPDVMASTVTAPLERQFGQIPGLKQMHSTSSDGASSIVLQFALDLNIDVAEQQVQEAINASQSYLPQDLPVPPVYSKSNPADTPVLTLALTSATLALPQVEDLADSRLVPKLSQLSGVGLVTISGGQKPAVRIKANPIALAAYGITLEDVRTSLVNTSVNAAKGSFAGSTQNYEISANDQLFTSKDFGDVLVAYRNGAPVMLSDVAKIADGVENTRLAAWMNQTPAVIVNIRRQPGANTIAVVQSVHDLLPQLQASLPASVRVITLADRTNTIRASIQEVESELVLTIGLVVMVIFLFLRNLSATIIPAAAIPISLVGTLAVLYLLGYSINNLTLMAMTISTGFVVDDAIVVVENIARYMEQGLTPIEAALEGSKQIGFTIISLTVSLVAVLLPLLLMGDIVGRMFREFAITVAATVVISGVVSLTLTPMMTSKLLRPTQAAQSSFHRWSERVFEQLLRAYGRSLRWILQHQFGVLALAAATLMAAVYLYISIPKGLFPKQDIGIIQGITQAPASISFSAMCQRQQEVAAILLRDPAVESLSSFVGIDGTNFTLNTGRIQINLKPVGVRRREDVSAVIARLQSSVGDVGGMELFMQPVQDLTVEDRVSRTQFQYMMSDADGTELDLWTSRLVQELKRLPELRNVTTDRQPNGLAEKLIIDRVSASRLKITPQQIDATLYDAFGQRQVSTLYTQTSQYHVVLEASSELQQIAGALHTMYLQGGVGQSGASTFSPTPNGRTGAASNSGSVPTLSPSSSSGVHPLVAMSPAGSTLAAPVPLSAIAHFQKVSSPLTIEHQGQFPVVTISFNLAPGVALSQAVNAIERVQRQRRMPVSVQAGFQGAAAAYQMAGANEALLIVAALVAVYIVLGVLYESFLHPLTILSTLPSAGVGALLALVLCKQDLGVVSLIGIILLVGIVKKNGIMIVDFAIEARRQRGLGSHEAIYEASLLRFRPILMTTCAAIFAAIPLALGSGVGSELRRPLGIAMVGGLLLSQVLTLYTTPVIYIFFERLGAEVSGRSAHRKVLQPAERL